MTKSILILHLSDLHFGPNSRFAGSKPEVLSQKLFLAIEDVSSRIKIEESVSLVIITGDIAEHARKEEYDIARSFFESLADKLKIDRYKFVFVPGNHDVSWTACKHVAVDQEDQGFNDEEFTTKISQIKFKDFKDFAEGFYGLPLEERGRPINYESYINNIDDLKLSIASLNSCEIESHRKKDQIGFLSDDHAQSLMIEWFSDKYESYIKIIALHHNPTPTVPENVEQGMKHLEALENDKKLTKEDVERFASDAVGFKGRDRLHNISGQCKVQLILHGHHHATDQNPWPWQKDGMTHVLSAGSWGLKDDLPKNQDNNFRLILLNLEEEKLDAWTLVYNPRVQVKGSVDSGNFTLDASGDYHQPLFLPESLKAEKKSEGTTIESTKAKRASFVFCLSIDLNFSDQDSAAYNKDSSKLDRWYKSLVDQTKPYLVGLQLKDSNIKFTGNCWQLMTDDPEKVPALCSLAKIMSCNFQDEVSKEKGISRDKVPSLRLAICGGSAYSVDLPDGRKEWIGNSSRNSNQSLSCCYPNEILIDEPVRSIIIHDFNLSHANIEDRSQEFQYPKKSEQFSLYTLGDLDRDSAAESDAAGYFIFTMEAIGNKNVADYIIKTGEKSLIRQATESQGSESALKILKKYNLFIYGLSNYSKIIEIYDLGKEIGIFPNVFTFSILIFKSPDYGEAKKWLEEMLKMGIEPNVVSYSTLIQKSPEYCEAKKWLEEMVEKGIEPDVVSYSTLIQKSPEYGEAKKWLEEMLKMGIESDVVSYNTLIQKSPDYIEAKKWLEEMLEMGIKPDVISYSTLIQKSPEYCEAKKWLEEMVEKGIEPDVVSYSTLIQKSPEYAEAKKWLEEMLEKGIEPNVVSYNTLIQKSPEYAEAKKWLEEILKKGIKPDVFSYNTLIQKSPDYVEAKKWLEEMLKKSIKPDVVSYNTLIRKSPEYAEARKWLEEMLKMGIEPDVFSYNTLIQKSPDYGEANKWLEEMLEKGIGTPNVVSYSTLIQKSPDYGEAKKWPEEMLKKGIEPNVVSYSTLIQKSPDYGEANKWLEEMLKMGIEPNVVSYNTLIQKSPEYGEAKKWLEEMLKKGIEPDVVSYSTLIQKSLEYGEAKKWLEEMLKKSIKPDVVSYSTLIRKSPEYSEAKKWLEEMLKKGIELNVFSYNALIQKSPDYVEAKKWLEAMTECGLNPNAVSYNTLIQKSPDYDESKKWLEVMMEKGFKPSVVSYNILIQSSPDHAEAKKWLESMIDRGLKPNAVSYNTLLQKSPDYEVAKKWVEVMIEKGIWINILSYNFLISKAPILREALLWFEEMRKKGIEPNNDSYKNLIQKQL